MSKPLTVSDSDDISMCIETVSGKLVNPTKPTPESIDVNDIAWAMSRQPRFAGHTITQIPYNVAQHSVYVSQLAEALICGESVPPELWQSVGQIKRAGRAAGVLLAALFHDGHEAYTSDIPSPIKRIPELRPTLKLIEGRLDHAIFMAIGIQELSEEEKLLVTYCDKLAQAIEGYQFMPSRGLKWNLPKPSLESLQKFPAPQLPLESYLSFIQHFEYLRKQ